MNWLRFRLRYFNYSRSERITVYFLMLYCVLGIATPEIIALFRGKKMSDFAPLESEIAQFRRQHQIPISQDNPTDTVAVPLFYFDPNSASFDDLVRLGLPARTAQTILNYRNKGGKFHRPEDFRKIYALRTEDFERLLPFIQISSPQRQQQDIHQKHATRVVPVLFPFDPNKISVEDLQQMGVPAALASRIVNYRKAGGVFRKKTDLKKIYGFPESLFEQIQTYIQLPDNQEIKSVTYAPGSPQSSVQHTSISVIDINQSQQTDWEKLPGIGTMRAESILRFRDKLGGFISVEQVRESRGLPDSVFQIIQPFLRFQSPIFRKINLNTATLEEMIAHPYLDRRHAQLILAYRAQHGDFKNPGEISRIGAFKDAGWLQKVMPYLSVE